MSALLLFAAPAQGAEAKVGAIRPVVALLQASSGTNSTRQAQPARATPEVNSVSMRATRAELTAALERFEREAARGSARDRARAQSEAAAIRARLRDGDFRPGDRVSLSAAGDSVARELSVRDGNQIELPYGIPPLVLTGVLRSELPDVVAAHLKKYVREPDVRVRALQRISVSGAVGRPGVYWVPTDLPLAEILMRAGGPTGSARLDRIAVARGNRTVVDRKTYARLVREGRTVEESNLLPGDEIRVQERTGRNWAQIATYSFFAISALTAALALIRSSYQ